jgi:signal transduction histidine kinase
VARHSKTDEAWVRLEETQTELCVEIRDQGAGFDPDGEMDRVSHEGVGLMGMRERAQHLHGKLSLESAPGHGTAVRVRIPLKRAPVQSSSEKVTQS